MAWLSVAACSGADAAPAIRHPTSSARRCRPIALKLWRRRATRHPVEQFDSMDNGKPGTGKLRHAADVTGSDQVRLRRLQMPQLAVAQPAGKFGLQHRVGSGGAAAD